MNQPIKRHPKLSTEQYIDTLDGKLYRYMVDGELYIKIGVGMGETEETALCFYFEGGNKEIVTLYNEDINKMKFVEYIS